MNVNCMMCSLYQCAVCITWKVEPSKLGRVATNRKAFVWLGNDISCHDMSATACPLQSVSILIH